MFELASSLVLHFFGRKKDLAVLDLGCGDGVFTAELLKVSDTLSATLIDGNEGMLGKAKERLAGFPLLSFLRAEFQDILAEKVPLGTYDLCVSSMAIHHLEGSEKAALFRLILSHLNNGGFFVNIDTVRPPSEELEGWYFALWKDRMAEMMERYGVTDEAPDDLIRRYKDPTSMNKPDTLGSQLKALQEAGFTDADCYFKNGIFAVFGGRKGRAG